MALNLSRLPSDTFHLQRFVYSNLYTRDNTTAVSSRPPHGIEPFLPLAGSCATFTPKEDIVNSFAHALLESNQFSLRNRTSLHYSGLPSPFTLTLTEWDRRAITFIPKGAVSSLRVRYNYDQLFRQLGAHGTPTWTRTKNVL